MNSIFCTYDADTGFATSCSNGNPPSDKPYIIIEQFLDDVDAWKVIDGTLRLKTDQERYVPESYDYSRYKSYPAYGDQLDAIYKGFLAIKDQVQLPQETLDWMQEVERVKSTYPKS